MTPAERTYIPESEFGKVFWRARIYLLIYLAVIGLAIATRSILPLMFIGLPNLYGAWLMVVYGLTQHAGLAENVLDHRLNTRTVYMNRASTATSTGTWAITSNTTCSPWCPTTTCRSCTS